MLLSTSNLQFSRWTFFKHLTPRKFKLAPPLCQHKSVATLSHFGILTSRQKDQIHLYVETLLQWNKVFSFSHSHNTTQTHTLPWHVTHNNCNCCAWTLQQLERWMKGWKDTWKTPSRFCLRWATVTARTAALRAISWVSSMSELALAFPE